MLESIRRLAAGGFAKILLALLILSFAVWGINDIFRGFTPDTVARVGGTEVPVSEFQRIYSIRMDNLRQQIGTISPELAQMLGVENEVLGTLLVNAAMDDQAATFGLGLSDETLAARIRNDTTWNRGRGFDQNYLDSVLSQNGLTRRDYEEQRRAEELRAQLAEGLVGSLDTPAAYRRALFEHRAETRNIQYVVLDEAHAGEIPAPTDAEITSFYQDNRPRYRAPEYRRVAVLTLTPEERADPEAISDEAVASAYEARRATTYTTPGSRRVSQIVFPTREEAEAARASLGPDKTFAQLTTTAGLAPTDIGVVKRTDIIADPAIADAAFAVGEGEVSPVVAGRFGFVLVRATEIVPEIVRPLDEVRAELRADLARREAVAQINTIRDEVEDALAGGETIEEAATRMGLPFRLVEQVDSGGLGPDDEPVDDLPGGPALLTELFQSDVGLANPPVEYASDTYAWFEVLDVIAPRDRTLDEVRDDVITAWRNKAIDDKLAADATALAARLKAGETIEAVAAERGLEVLTATALIRSSDATATLSGAAIDAAFGGPDGLVVVARGASGPSEVILKVTSVVVPPYQAAVATETEAAETLDRDVSNDILAQYVSALQNQLGVSVNQAAMQLAISTAR